MHERLRTVRDGVLILRVVRDAPSDDIGDDSGDDDEVGSKQWLRRLSRASPCSVDLQVADRAEVGRLQGPRAEWLAYRCREGVIQAETARAVDGLVLGCLGMLTAVTSALEQRNGFVGVCRMARNGCPWQNLPSVLGGERLLHTEGAEGTASAAPAGDADLVYEVVEYSVTRIRVPAPTCGSARDQLEDQRETLQASAELVRAGNAGAEAPSRALRSVRHPRLHRWRRLGVTARNPSVNPGGAPGGKRGPGECCDEEDSTGHSPEPARARSAGAGGRGSV